ncbi:polyprotein-like, partial [Trifolium medium]|nr:polyprotein-like [Trifolium medium]
MTGTLKEWYHNLGTFKQDELHRLENVAAVLGVLHNEFIGDMEIFDRKSRQEFFEMRYCSLKVKDLEKHYQRMSQRYYVLNGHGIERYQGHEPRPDTSDNLGGTREVVQSTADEETVFALQDSSSDEGSPTESGDDGYFPIYSFKEIGSTLPTPPLPCVEDHVIALKFSHPKKVIAYMDIKMHG